MAVTSTDDRRQMTDIVVRVRIPDGSDGDLTTEAQRRLARADGVIAVTVDGVQALDPGLSATDATVSATVERPAGATVQALTAALDDVVGVTVVEA